MTKNISRILCAVLALLMVASAVACLAETETKTYKTYTPLDAQYHTVIEETWVYPVINGKASSGHPAGDSHLGSGHPAGDNTYEEAHTFENGACIYCGYKAETFTNAMGVVLTKGMPADEALKQVLSAIPADANLSFVNAADAGNTLSGLVNNAAAPAEYTPALAAFPAQTVEDTPSNVVTLSYTGANGAAVTENYAFSTADATLVSLF